EGRPMLERLQERLHDAQNALISLRRVPLTALFNRYPRMVREMSQALGKEVLLRTEGGEIALDRRVVDELSSLLMHLLRNALDHALETPEERIQAGKTRQGTVWLSAYPLDGKVRIEVRDDGRGIDPQRMRERIAELGCLSAEEARHLSDEAAIDWIFEAGFSTRDAVSCFSGRGVGMDVVRSRIAELGGVVSVETVPGEGTAFMLDLEPQ
ncbi:MAG: chemotaxis protein CheA, partial [Bacteroidota bacterium]